VASMASRSGSEGSVVWPGWGGGEGGLVAGMLVMVTSLGEPRWIGECR
jgi:hypothetical protein